MEKAQQKLDFFDSLRERHIGRSLQTLNEIKDNIADKADKHFTYCNESWQESPLRSALQSGPQRLFLSVERNAAHDFIVPVYKI